MAIDGHFRVSCWLFRSRFNYQRWNLYIQQMSNKVLKKEFYNIEKILDRQRSVNGSFEYLVKWKNYAHKFNTWQPIGHLFPVRSLVEKFNEQYQMRMKAEKFRNSNNCLACSNNNKNCKSRTNNMFENLNKREKLVQVKIDQFLKPLSPSKQPSHIHPSINSFQYRLAHHRESPSDNFDHYPKKQQKSAQSTVPYNNNLSECFITNNLHPANLFSSTNSQLKQKALFEQDLALDYVNRFQQLSPMIDQLELEHKDLDSEQIFKIDIIQEQASQPALRYNRQENQINIQIEPINNGSKQVIKESQAVNSRESKQKKIMEESQEKQNQYSSNDCTLLTEKQKNDWVSGSSEKSQKLKDKRDPEQQDSSEQERQRSRKKRRQYKILQQLKKSSYLCLETKKRREKFRNQSTVLGQQFKPKIRIKQIPQPTTINQQLIQFNHKRICEIAYENLQRQGGSNTRNRIVFKMQNINKQIVKVDLQEIKNHYPKWLKEYFQSYI